MDLSSRVEELRAGLAAAKPATLRYLLAGLASAVVVLLLFMLIYGMIAGGGDVMTDTTARLVDYSRLPHELRDPPRRRETLQKPPPPEPAPSFAAVTTPPRVTLPALPVDSAPPAFAVPVASGAPAYLTGGAPTGLLEDGDVVPLLRDAPQYPHEALVNRTEGWVEIEFTIAADGTVKDPVVIDAQPSRVFERDALRAIAHWKFKPYTVAGVPVERRARQVIQFTLAPAG